MLYFRKYFCAFFLFCIYSFTDIYTAVQKKRTASKGCSENQGRVGDIFFCIGKMEGTQNARPSSRTLPTYSLAIGARRRLLESRLLAAQPAITFYPGFVLKSLNQFPRLLKMRLASPDLLQNFATVRPVFFFQKRQGQIPASLRSPRRRPR